MKKTIIYLITIILSVFLGAGIMYYLINNSSFFKTSVVNKYEKEVTVTDKGIADGINNIYDSVVVIENYQNSKLASIGSGFVYSKDGYIMTNHHVIEKAKEIKVILMSGEVLSASVVGSDEYADIAVIKIDPKYVTSVAKIGSSEKTNVGDTVFTIGSPMSSDYAGTVTRGILSGKNRMVEVSVSSSSNDWIMNVMQTDAAINPGNSGGPLCNVNGEVIGINSMKIVQSEIEGIGFAISIEDAIDCAKKIISGEEIKRSYLGISMSDLSVSSYYLRKENITIDSSIKTGVIVVEAVNDGPCAAAGIEKGDVIVKVGKYDVKNIAELRYYLYKYNPKETIEVKVKRGKEEKIFKVTLGES